MAEADILVAWGGLTGLIISVVSVSFGMISAYIVGLWLFLKDAPLALRLIAFSLLTFGLMFMGMLAWGLHELFLGTQRAWNKLPASVTEIRVFFDEGPDYLYGLSIYEVGAGLGFLVFGAIYLAVAYVSFLYRWPQDGR